MQPADLKRPRAYIPLALILLLAIVSAVVFHPGFQRKMLLDHVGPLVDGLAVDEIHFTPWSLDVTNLRVDYQGGQFELAHGRIRYCLSSLLLLDLNIQQLVLDGVKVDLANFNPPPVAEASPPVPPEEDLPFPGVLASLRHGVGYSLQQVAISADVVLPDQQAVAARISGGGIRPKTRGALDLDLRFNTGKGDDHVLVNGTLGLDQLTRGNFAAIEAALSVQAALATLPKPEQVDITLAVTPAPPDQQPDTTPAAAPEPLHTPERLQLALRQDDEAAHNRSALELAGVYDGNDGRFAGSYRVTGNERLVRPYLKADSLPPSQAVLKGDIDFNIASVTGDMTVVSDLLVSDLQKTAANERLPELLRLENNFRLSLLPDRQLRVATLTAGVSDEREHQPLAASLPADLNIPLKDIDGFLHQENTLLEFELPDVPLTWFDIFLPGRDITDGHLSGAFRITTDTESVIHLKPIKPLEIRGLTIREADAVLIDGMNLSVRPAASYAGDTLHIALDKLTVDAKAGMLATATLKARLPLAGDASGSVDISADADLNMHNLLAFLDIRQSGRQAIPRHFSVDLKTVAQQRSGSIVVSRLDASMAKDGETRLLKLALSQPLVLRTGGDGSPIGNTEGPLAQLNMSDIRLEWFSAFVPDTTLRGVLRRADLTLAADGKGITRLSASRPVRLDHVTVAGKTGPILQDVGLSLSPVIQLAATETRIDYKDLRVISGQADLIAASGTLILPRAADRPLLSDGRVDVDIQALARQPLVANLLQGNVVAPVRLQADYRLARGSSGVDIDRLAVDLFYSDPEPRLSLTADSKVRVRTRLGRSQSELGRARGTVTLAITRLTPEPFKEILAANGLTFSEANGKAVLSSDGKWLKIDSQEPLTLTGIVLKGEDGALLHPFTLRLGAGVALQGDTLEARLDPFSLAFDRDKGVSAVDGTVDLILDGSGARTRVRTLNANLTAALPALLDQPGLLPDHRLKAGRLESTTRIDADGKLASTTVVEGLQAPDDLALERLALKLDGQLDADGSFTVTAPISTVGKSGSSDLVLKAVHTKQEGVNDELTGSATSTLFYLNDILNTLHAIAGRPAREQTAAKQEPDEEAKAKAAAREALPDVRAFWDTIPYNRRIIYDIGQLFYTDYLVIHDIRGRGEFTPGRFALEEFEAHFHNSPIRLNAVMTFTPGDTPYDLNFQAGVEQFDLAKFFRELVPDAKPRAEGLFDVHMDASGQSPNMAMYRNNLFFDMQLQSRDGIFRLLDPNSPLVTGGTGVAGFFGEGFSYVPTGLFGLGAVSRLVNYIKEIEYDKIDIALARDETRDVQIRRYVVQNTELLMTASGGIEYQEGVDILHSPLSMDAQLDFRGHGAAIMYDLDLLQSEKNDYGYWKGPGIRFWGTAAASQSNLDEIISKAGQGAVLGGITRPISGLIGNIKHLWTRDSSPIEYDGQPVGDTGRPEISRPGSAAAGEREPAPEQTPAAAQTADTAVQEIVQLWEMGKRDAAIARYRDYRQQHPDHAPQGDERTLIRYLEGIAE